MRFLFKCFHPISQNTYERKIKLNTHERNHHTHIHTKINHHQHFQQQKEIISNYYYYQFNRIKQKHRSSHTHTKKNRKILLNGNIKKKNEITF